jgi:hypothetical protein
LKHPTFFFPTFPHDTHRVSKEEKISEKSMEDFMLGKAHSLRLYPYTEKKKSPK